MEADDAGTRAAHSDLVSQGCVEPVAVGTEDERIWANCDLASLAENRLGVSADPRKLDDEYRGELFANVAAEGLSLPSQREFEDCYWLLEAGKRVGTVALASRALGSPRLRLSSLYVLPEHRHQGVGSRAVQQLKAGLGRYGLGLRLETSWCWSAAVAFYLREGFWLHGWKRELTFVCDAGDPPPLFEQHGDVARLAIDTAAGRTMLARLERDGERLLMDDQLPAGIDDCFTELAWRAPSTLALWLALRSWPQ